jgi:GNAT superfamily N-acetyltransferase
MSLDLGVLADLPERLPNLTVQAVASRALLTRWSAMLGATTGLPKGVMASIFGPLGLGPDAAWRHYIGSVDGTPVATCSLFRSAESVGVYWVSTAPGARRQGVASALVHHLLKMAPAQGHRLAVLQSTEMARGVYRSLGFAEHAPIGVYTWSLGRQRR